MSSARDDTPSFTKTFRRCEVVADARAIGDGDVQRDDVACDLTTDGDGPVEHDHGTVDGDRTMEYDDVTARLVRRHIDVVRQHDPRLVADLPGPGGTCNRRPVR